MNLDFLTKELPAELEAAGFAVFYVDAATLEPSEPICWDAKRAPDYHAFLDVARRAGATFVYLSNRIFDTEELDDELASLETAEFSRDERRQAERKLRSFGSRAGQTCSILLAFEHHSRLHVFDFVAPWYEEFVELSNEINDRQPDDDEPEAMNPYFSNN